MKRLSAIIAILLWVPGVLSASDIADNLNKLMDLYEKHNLFQGTVLVAHHGEVIFSRGMGLANMEHGVPNTPETKFRIASISKQFTAMIVLQLVSEGKMDLHASIRTYIPDYPAPQGDVITIHHLLSNTSGMPHYAGIPDFFPTYGRQAFDHRTFVELFWNLDLLFEPGSQYSYSSFGFYLLGYVLETIEDKPMTDILRERIFDKLDMHDTGVVDHRSILSHAAYGYDFLLNGFLTAEYRDLSTALATGDMYTTALDMVRWDRALANYTLLDKTYQDKMFVANHNGYGYGWVVGNHRLNENDSIYFQQHTGGTNGFTSIATRLPDDGYYILVFCNTRPGEIRQAEQGIVRILYGKTPEFRPSLPIAAASILDESGLEACLAFLEALYREELDPAMPEFILNAEEWSRLTMEFLRAGRVHESLQISRLGYELYPQSPQVLTALGDALLRSEYRDEAIRAYARALDLKPSYTPALERMQRL